MSKRVLQEDVAEAIERNDLTSIKSWLSSGEVDANAIIFEKTLLVFAVQFTCKSVVELLLNAGARIDDVDYQRQSACHVAAKNGDTGTMRVLLAHRPNLALKNGRGKSALQLAICSVGRYTSNGKFSFNESDDVAMQLIRAGASLDDLDRDELCRFAAINTAAIQLLMNRNIVIGDLRGEFGQTPLHFAALFRTIDSVLRKLVDCGVDLEAREVTGRTCTEIAIEVGDFGALRLFLQAGADVDGTDDRLLLHRAAFANRFNLMMYLLVAGADVAARDRQGRTAFTAVTETDSLPPMWLVHALLAAGADLDAADELGNTPRQLLADRQWIIVPELVERMRREIAMMRLDFVRHRAMEVCIGLQSLRLDALQVCEILQYACGPLARLIAFHQWWKIATTVKHF
jgi:ankyrin repeat protein